MIETFTPNKGYSHVIDDADTEHHFSLAKIVSSHEYPPGVIVVMRQGAKSVGQLPPEEGWIIEDKEILGVYV